MGGVQLGLVTLPGGDPVHLNIWFLVALGSIITRCIVGTCVAGGLASRKQSTMEAEEAETAILLWATVLLSHTGRSAQWGVIINKSENRKQEPYI